MLEGEYLIEMSNITKRFSGVLALDDVDFKVRKGEIHALVGENGAGKSTLMNILSGKFSHHTFEGVINVNGNPFHFNNPKDANKAGIVMVHQELALIPELSVAENMFLGNLIIKNSAVDWKTINKEAQSTLHNLSLNIDVRMKVKYLSIGQQQLVEISKAVMLGGKVMILDEPTSPLTGREIDMLFKLLRELRDKGITIIYISHRMEEIFELTDYVSVMRDGKMIATIKTSDTNQNQLVSFMIGREMNDFYPKDTTIPTEVMLRVKDYFVPHPTYQGKNIVNGVSMEFKGGEIVGISGLLGSGRTELFSAVVGSYSRKGRGVIEIQNKQIEIKTPGEAIRHGIGFVTEDRKHNGLIINQSIRFNSSLVAINKIQTRKILDKRKENALVADLVKKLAIKTDDYYNPVSSLSGGNQQKVVIGKWIATNPKILILDEPTRGVDVGAKFEIYTIMKTLAKNGVAIIMISSDLPEVIGMSDRVYIMHEGIVTGEIMKKDLSEDNIMLCATCSGIQKEAAI